MNFEAVTAFAVTPIFIAGFAGAGGFMLRRAGYAETAAESIRLAPVAVALGFAGYSYLGYLSAMFGSVPAWLIVCLLLSGVLLGHEYLRSLACEFRPLARRYGEAAFSPVGLMLSGLALLLLALVLVNALSPVKEGDSLQGYMFTSRWVAEVGLVYNPYNPQFSLFPLNTELVYAWSYPFGTDLIAKCLDIVLGLFFLGAVFEFGCRFTAARYSLLAVVSLLVMREFINNWGVGKIDIPASLTFFAGLSLLFQEGWKTTSPRLAVAAFLLGTACSQKYTLWILALAVPVVVLSSLRGKTPARKFAALMLVIGIVMICLTPHFIKNMWWTNNPVAPFAGDIFPSKNIQLIPLSDVNPTPLRELPSLPYKLFFEGYLDNWTGRLPLLVLPGLLALLMWTKIKTRGLFFVAVTAAVQLILWVAIRQQAWLAPRFLIIIISLFLIAGAWVVGEFCRERHWGNWVVVGALFYLLLLPGIWTHRHWRASLSFVAGLESRAEWQARVAPARAYNDLHRVAEYMDADHKLLIGSELYNLPQTKLSFASTEKEVTDFLRLPDEAKLSYLKEHRFAFYHQTEKAPQAWASGLPVFAEYQPRAKGDLQYKISRIAGDVEPKKTGLGNDFAH